MRTPIRALRLLPVLPSLCLSIGCGSPPDLAAWRRDFPSPRPTAERGNLEAEIQRVRRLRKELDLAGSRELALRLVAENPERPAILSLASRAESDQVFMLPADDREERNAAALSALDYSRRAVSTMETPPVELLAQHAWAMGTSTHLQPMFDRSDHASATLEVIESCLGEDPDNAVALATKSILRLRLATLPWIATVMAWGAPEGSVEEAITLGRRCVELVPSIENRLILARALVAGEKVDEARSVLQAAAASEDRYPRDSQLRPDAGALLASLGEEDQ